MFTCLNKPISEEDLINHFSTDSKLPINYTAMTIGATKREEDKFASVYEKTDERVKFLCIDVANGYTEYFSNFVYGMRSTYPNLTIIAGNVVTADMTQELIINGADIVKVGIGPGSVCTTRIQTGVGYPQLSAVIECADAAHGLGAHVIADGGCSSPGDIAKAFGGGADFVMLGGMLAGHDQGGGEVIDNTVRFYGMSSETANDKHFGGLRDYRAAEGKEVKIPYKGDVRNTVQDILGSLRSTCTYIGAKRLKDIPKCATFIRCSDTHNRVYE
jgi:GMP reductase